MDVLLQVFVSMWPCCDFTSSDDDEHNIGVTARCVDAFGQDVSPGWCVFLGSLKLVKQAVKHCLQGCWGVACHHCPQLFSWIFMLGGWANWLRGYSNSRLVATGFWLPFLLQVWTPLKEGKFLSLFCPVFYKLWASLRLGNLRGGLRGCCQSQHFCLGIGFSSVEVWFSSTLDIEEVLSLTDMDDNATWLSVDGIGAFDLVSCGKQLLEVEGGASALLFVRQNCGSPSTCSWDDDDGVTHEITQGRW